MGLAFYSHYSSLERATMTSFRWAPLVNHTKVYQLLLDAHAQHVTLKRQTIAIENLRRELKQVCILLKHLPACAPCGLLTCLPSTAASVGSGGRQVREARPQCEEARRKQAGREHQRRAGLHQGEA